MKDLDHEGDRPEVPPIGQEGPREITDYLTFWFILSFTLAGLTIFAFRDGGLIAGALMMLNTMLASANFGAKSVRAEIREDAGKT